MNSKLERKLVAIMFTDMVGFTELMQRDEFLGLQRRNRHKEVIAAQHSKFQGEIIQYFGDGTLSIFHNSCDAVECAIEIQKAIKTPVQVPLRIGIHSGNVIIEEDGIIGDAVNIASRIESFANTGGVLISDVVYDQVKNQTQWDYVHLGKFQLKNVHRPFEMYAISSPGIAVPSLDELKGKGEMLAILKGNVPIPSTPILGRKHEISNVIDLLKKHKVVTITGTGGIGKTRLALEICRSLDNEFKDGMAFVSMANLTEASEVMPYIATVLDIHEAKNRRLIEGVAALISSKKALLILDNLEQVISAAKEIAELAAYCPNLNILCTSRTPLKIQAEQEYVLQPLPLPENHVDPAILHNPAIKLFVDRAQKVNMDFELTDENLKSVLKICQRMDGLPLALELAAARIRILPVDKLLKRLSRALDLLTTGFKDVPKRHQTLRSTINWSHNLLEDSEKQLFRRLGIFANGFTLDAIEAVCYENEDDAMKAMDELESLLDKSLVKSMDDKERFSLLQTINDFAIEQLKESGETNQISKKHANYFHKISRKINLGTHGVQQLKRMQVGVQEDANLQVALDYLLDQARQGNEEAGEMGLSICGELFMYWHIKGKHQTAKQYVNAFLATTDIQDAGLGKCKALFCLHVATFTLGEIEETRLAANQNHEMAKRLGDSLEIGKSYFSLGWAHFFDNLEKAEKLCDEGIDCFRKMRHDSWLGFTLWQKGLINIVLGKIDRAKDAYTESLQLFQKTKNYEGMGCAQSGLAMIQFITGQHEKAIEEYLEALAAFKAIGDRPEEARVLSEISWTHLANKNTFAARRYTLESIQAYEEVGSTKGIGLSMNGLAAIEAVEGRPQKAVEIAAAAEFFAEQKGVVIEFGINNHGKIYLDKAEKELSKSQLENAKATGSKLTLSEVLEMTATDVIPVS